MIEYLPDVHIGFNDNLTQAMNRVSEAIHQFADELVTIFREACDPIGDVVANSSKSLPKWCQEKILEYVEAGIHPSVAAESILMEFEQLLLMERIFKKERSTWCRKPVIQQTIRPRRHISLWKNTGHKARSRC